MIFRYNLIVLQHDGVPPLVLNCWLYGHTQFQGRSRGKVNVPQHLSCESNHVGFARSEDLFCLGCTGDESDGTNGEAGNVLLDIFSQMDLVGWAKVQLIPPTTIGMIKGQTNLVARSDWDLLKSPITARAHVDHIDTSFLDQLSAELGALFDAPLKPFTLLILLWSC